MTTPGAELDPRRWAALAVSVIAVFVTLLLGVAWLMAPALLLAGLGGGSVITPNQALSLAEVDVRGGSTAGGVLQTGQRIGNAIGAAVISAVFYAQVSGAAAGGAAREQDYGRGYAIALAVSVGLTGLALVVAVRDVRRRPVRG